jgi:hypothetical protein
MAGQANIVRAPEDLAEVDAILGGLRGVRCWRARLSYGDELMLDLGERRDYDSPLMAGQQRGEWVLGLRASAWTVGPDADLADLEGDRVRDASAGYPNLGLVLRFDSGAELAVIPDPGETDLAAWELFTPAGMLLRAGPGPHWVYKRAA